MPENALRNNLLILQMVVIHRCAFHRKNPHARIVITSSRSETGGAYGLGLHWWLKKDLQP